MVSWDATFGNAVAARSVAEMVAILQSLSSDHAGTPNAATMSRALKLIRAAAAGDSLFELACGLADADSCAAQELGAVLLADVYGIHAAEVEAVLCRLADSESWEVREWVASACGQVLTDHFDRFYPTAEAWCGHPAGNVRRAVAVGIKYAVRQRYPAETLDRLAAWAEQADEQVRWNVAMAFAGAEGARHVAMARDILGRLAADPRRMGQQAVQTALRNLDKRCG